MVSSEAEMLIDIEVNIILTAEITEDWPVSVAFIKVQEIITDNKADYPSLASNHESCCNDYLMQYSGNCSTEPEARRCYTLFMVCMFV